MVVLPYGRTPYPLDLGGRAATILEPASLPPPLPVAHVLQEALAVPLGRPPLASMVSPGARVTVIISDATRDEPRAAFLEVLRAHLPGVRWTLAIATGTHGPANLVALDLPDIRDMRLVNHDGHATEDLVTLGRTSRGTPVRVHRCLVDADLVVATGCIKPHYFAGFGAGTKAMFPGLGEATAIRINHRLKAEVGARAGLVDENPCRLDLEEAASLLATPTFLLDGVCGPDHLVHAAVAGDPVLAFRRGAALARPWFTVRAARAALVIASDALPVAASLYQAAKIATAVAPLVAEHGTLVIVAACAEGVEPLETVNEAIFRIGVLPRLPRGASIHLVSDLPASMVERTLVRPAASVQDVMEHVPGSILVAPRASQLIAEAES